MSFPWLLGVLLACGLVGLSSGFHVVIVCAMDLFRGYMDAMEGFTVPIQNIGGRGIGTLGMTVLLPEGWHYASCCQRIQMTLFPAQLSATSARNVSSAEWTHCTSDVKHMTCVTQPPVEVDAASGRHVEDNHDVNPTDPSIRSMHASTEPIMLALTLQQCQMPELNQVTWEMFLFTNSSSDPSTPAPLKGTADVSVRSSLAGAGTHLSAMGSWQPCVLTGGLDTAKHQFPLKLGSVTITHPTSFSYSFAFILDKPSNEVVFEVLFVNGDLPDTLCDGKPHISLFQLEAPRKISLSIGNAWSGCRVENVEGEPVYFCEGGRTFVRPGELDIYVAVCKLDFNTLLNYTLEILESREDCSLQSGFRVSG